MNNNYVCIVSNPTEPTTIDATFDFVCKSPEEISQKTIVPLMNNHELSEDPMGTVELVHIPVFKNKEGKDVCLIVGNISTPYELADGTPISMGAPLVYKKGSVNFYDDILEVSVVDKAHVPSCAVYKSDALVDLVKAMLNDPSRKALFQAVLRSIGELDAVPSNQLH
jgi:hypothetical protein